MVPRAASWQQPDVFVVCDDPTRKRLLGDEDFAVPSAEEIIDVTIRLGSRTNPAIRCGGVCLNTSALSESDAYAMIERESGRLNLPVADPMRGGEPFERLIDSCID